MLRQIAMLFAGLLLLAGSPVSAQQGQEYVAGTLEISAAMRLRIGVAIAQGLDGVLRGTLNSPDQQAFDIPIAALERDGGQLAFTVPAIGGRYAARWNGAAQAWEGTWLQGGQAWPLVLRASEKPQRTAPPPLPADWQVPTDAAIGAIIDARLAGRTGAGMVIGVIEPGGSRLIMRGPGMEADTVFEIGSITKVFTALLLAEAAARGEAGLDDPVQAHLPLGAAMPGNGGEAITLRQLSQHKSGLPRLPENMPLANPADPYADYTEAMLLEFLRSHTLTRAPGAEFEYSNLGVGLLGLALARAANTDYEALVRSRILAPLGMADSGITLSPSQEARFAWGFDGHMQTTPPWNLPALPGAGALRSTPQDMLRFLGAVIDPASPIALAVAGTLDGWQPMAGQVTGLGWMGFAPSQGPVMFHGGGTGGYRAAIAAQPAMGRAVVVLTNTAVEPSAEDIAFHLIAGTPIAPTSPVPPPPPAPIERKAITLTPEQLAHVTGTYRLAPGVDGTIRLTNGGLTAQITGQPAVPIYPSAPLEFFWRAVEAQITFTEENGQVTGAVLHQGGQDIPLNRVGD